MGGASSSTEGEFPPHDKLHVVLEVGQSLPSADWGSKSDPRVIIEVQDLDSNLPTELLPNTRHTFSTKHNTEEPIWFESAFLVWPRCALSESSEVRLKLKLVDADTLTSDDTLLHTEVSVHKDRSSTCWERHTLPVAGGGELVVSIRFEPAEEMQVSKSDYEAVGLETAAVFELKHGDLTGGGRAVLVRARRAGNTRAVLWLPGLNSSFHQTHTLPALLAAGWDVYSLDCRRMGRAKAYAGADWDPLLAHDTGAFEEYIEEVDSALEYIKDSGHYTTTVFYANSTGALTALCYLRSGQGKHASDIAGLALNGPFLDWDFGAATELALEHDVLTDAYAKVVVGGKGDKIALGGKISAYYAKVRSQFYFPAGLRSARELHTTARWAKAVTRAQSQYLRDATKKPLAIPCLVVSSLADAYLSPAEINALSDLLGPRRSEAQISNARHDVLVSATAPKSAEALGHFVAWLRRFEEPLLSPFM